MMSAITDYLVLRVRLGFPHETDKNEDPGDSTNIRGLLRENGTNLTQGHCRHFDGYNK